MYRKTIQCNSCEPVHMHTHFGLHSCNSQWTLNIVTIRIMSKVQHTFGVLEVMRHKQIEFTTRWTGHVQYAEHTNSRDIR